MTEQKAKRKLENMNLLDDFLFGKMISYQGIGETFVCELLRIIFNRKFDRLTVVPQKVYYGNDTDKHGARLDVYLEEIVTDNTMREEATVYDIEPDQNVRLENKTNLPKRTRFYHAMIDAGCLESGQNYGCLKNVIVIMITSYDPFGLDHVIYTIRSKCEELPDMPYDDGARTLFLYTGGSKGNISQELRDLLKYMEKTTEENATSATLRKIQKMVQQVKQDKGVTLEYMKIFEREEMLLEQGREEGRQEGRQEGRKEERANTEREKKRADIAEHKVKELLEELQRLQAQEE